MRIIGFNGHPRDRSNRVPRVGTKLYKMKRFKPNRLATKSPLSFNGMLILMLEKRMVQKSFHIYTEADRCIFFNRPMTGRIIIAIILSMNICIGYCQVNSADTILATVEQFAREIIYQDQDTNYIKSYIDKLSVKVLILNKFNTFQLKDKNLGNTIRFRPDLGVNFGIGFAYKWLALEVD